MPLHSRRLQGLWILLKRCWNRLSTPREPPKTSYQRRKTTKKRPAEFRQIETPQKNSTKESVRPTEDSKGQLEINRLSLSMFYPFQEQAKIYWSFAIGKYASANPIRHFTNFHLTLFLGNHNDWSRVHAIQTIYQAYGTSLAIHPLPRRSHLFLSWAMACFPIVCMLMGIAMVSCVHRLFRPILTTVSRPTTFSRKCA